ncbi:hypothetical protein CYMTET_3084 [Cymbomonas tetramitiformis]|uniref:Uncharacterized protein n=1 Tax=Cymbomonas tetramitiformis TaxID=36881 RepID=A0AAE0LLE9_9CHLO|nr:hypothetical protein CYMTET_3084 [Cymbomonas tetramitiformis]
MTDNVDRYCWIVTAVLTTVFAGLAIYATVRLADRGSDSGEDTYEARYEVRFDGQFYPRYVEDKPFRSEFITNFCDQSVSYADRIATTAKNAHVHSVREGSVIVLGVLHFQNYDQAVNLLERMFDEVDLAFPRFAEDKDFYGSMRVIGAFVNGDAVHAPPSPYSLPPGPHATPEPLGVTHQDTWLYYPSCARFGLCTNYMENVDYTVLDRPERWRAVCPYAWAINPKTTYAWEPRVYVSTCGIAVGFVANGVTQICNSSTEVEGWLNDPAHNADAYCRSFCDATDCIYPDYAARQCACDAVPAIVGCPGHRSVCCTPKNESNVRCFCVGHENYAQQNTAGIAGDDGSTNSQHYYTCDHVTNDACDATQCVVPEWHRVQRRRMFCTVTTAVGFATSAAIANAADGLAINGIADLDTHSNHA